MATRVPFYFTYVTYERGDWWGYLMAVAALAPQAVSCALGGAFVATATWPGRVLLLYVVAGQFANEFFNVALKHHFKEPRPFQERIDYAMPSSHAQYAAYIAIVFYALVVKKCIHNGLHRAVLSAGCFLVTIFVPYSRLYLGYHDLRQIMYGLAFGALFGSSWVAIYRKANLDRYIMRKVK